MKLILAVALAITFTQGNCFQASAGVAVRAKGPNVIVSVLVDADRRQGRESRKATRRKAAKNVAEACKAPLGAAAKCAKSTRSSCALRRVDRLAKRATRSASVAAKSSGN